LVPFFGLTLIQEFAIENFFPLRCWEIGRAVVLDEHDRMYFFFFFFSFCVSLACPLGEGNHPNGLKLGVMNGDKKWKTDCEATLCKRSERVGTKGDQ
jgi:hypothetical protein